MSPSSLCWHRVRLRAGPLLRALTAALLLLSSVDASPAGAPLSPADSPAFVGASWQVEDGLPQGSVLSLVQTPEGDLWFGTQSGLVRFDGLTFNVYTRRSHPGLVGNYVSTLLVDRRGRLWIGSGRGLSCYEQGRFRQISIADPRAVIIVTALAEQADGVLWVATRSGLFRGRDGHFEHVVLDAAAGMPEAISSLVLAPDGGLWIGGLEVLVHRRADGTWKRWGTAQGLPAGEEVRAIALGPDGRTWVAGRRLGPLRLGDDERFRAVHARWPYDVVETLYLDRQARLWAGTARGLVRVDPSRPQAWQQPEITDDHVMALLEDREGQLWIGTERGGLNRFREPSLRTYTRREGLAQDPVMTVLEDSAGALWMGTRAGLTHFQGGRMRTFTTRDGLAGDDVLALAPARDGGVWIGHMRGRVSRYREGRVQPVELGPLRAPVLALHEQPDGTLWIGTGQGLARLRDGRLQMFTARDGLPDENVFRVMPARDGGLWIATRAGLVAWRDNRLQALPELAALAREPVVSLLEDPDGTLWLGTFGAGLARLRAGRLSLYGTQQGLFDDTIYEIVDDGLGHLWTSSNRGLARLRRSDVEAFDAGRSAGLLPTVYGRSDGMASVECNGGSQPVGLRARDGRLWFATVGGAVVVDPGQLRRSAGPPSVRLESASVDRRLLDLADPRPAPSRGDLEFRYSARTLAAPEKVRFRYRLVGFDEEWNQAGARRVANYTNVPPGHYRFEVEAVSDAGEWSPAAALVLGLPPQFYQTWWFRALPLLALMWLGWGLHQWRMRRLEAHAAVLAERHRMACELHDGLAQGLAGLVRMIDAVRLDLPSSAQSLSARLERAQEVARSSLMDARRSVRALRPQELEREGLAEALAQVARRLTAGTGIHLDVDVSGRPLQLPPDREQHLFRTVQEALSNAVRHAGATRIRLRVQYGRRCVRVRVLDDGCGLAAGTRAQAGNGFGLSGMRERMRLAGGRLRLVTRPGAGTEVAALVPLGGTAAVGAGRAEGVGLQ